MNFVENLEMTHALESGRGGSVMLLRHYDALHTKIDI